MLCLEWFASVLAHFLSGKHSSRAEHSWSASFCSGFTLSYRGTERFFLLSLIYLPAISWKFSDGHYVLYAALLALEHNVHWSLREMSLFTSGYSGSPASWLSFLYPLLPPSLLKEGSGKAISFLRSLPIEDMWWRCLHYSHIARAITTLKAPLQPTP